MNDRLFFLLCQRGNAKGCYFFSLVCLFVWWAVDASQAAERREPSPSLVQSGVEKRSNPSSRALHEDLPLRKRRGHSLRNVQRNNPPPPRKRKKAEDAHLPSPPIEKNKIYLVAWKRRYRMSVFLGKRVLRTYKVVFGIKDKAEKNGGDKQAAGDDRSPLGSFLIDQASAVSDSDFGGYWMRLDTTVKAREMYKQRHKKIVARWGRPWGQIKGDGDVRAFNRWAKRHNYPLLFRGIGIHGGGWEATNGCIGLSNKDMKDLYPRLSSFEDGIIGIRVEIRP